MIDEELRDERIAFYSNNGIGWVARPEHDKSADGFKRKGKFKKASNMNFALALSCAMEDKLMSLERHQAWNSTDEAEATVWALEQAVNDGGNIAWADGNIRIGDYILISESMTASYGNLHLELTGVSQLILIPEFPRTVSLTLSASLRYLLKSPFSSSHLGLCKSSTTISKTVSPFSPT